MLLLIILIVIVILAALFFPKKKLPIRIYKKEELPTALTQKVPDSPVNFGYKCMWYAVKTVDKQKLAEKLGLNNVSDCNWHTGIERAYKGSVFITPAIDGWTLACGLGLAEADGKDGIGEIKKCWNPCSQGIRRGTVLLHTAGNRISLLDESDPGKNDPRLCLPW